MPGFDTDVPHNGYRWWYIDGVSDCRRYGLVVIAFVGSVFSPYYYRARRKTQADPTDFCAINVASYGPRANAWAMTERGRRQLRTTADSLQIGKSRIDVCEPHIDLSFQERTTPWLRRLQGNVRVTADHTSSQIFKLDANERHCWQPIAPVARIKVALTHPTIDWQGDAYVDTNYGVRPLEDDFRSWHWSSLRTAAGSDIHYDTLEKSGRRHCIALSANNVNELAPIRSSSSALLQNSRWGIARESQHEDAKIVKTLEDTPFYARSLLSLGGSDGPAFAVHESLSLERFSSAWVRTLLPFRMPRITR